MAKKQPKPKKVRNGEVEHLLLKYFSERIGGPLDGFFGSNYDSCEELVARCIKHGSDPEQTIKALIDIATSDDCWHKNNATNFRYLLNHGRQIWNSSKQHQRINNAEQAADAAARIIIARRQARGHDPDDVLRYDQAGAGASDPGTGGEADRR